MKKRGRRSRLFLCFRPIFVDDDLRPTKKLKLPIDPSGEEDSNVSDAGHCHRFSGALKSVMSDLFMTKRLGSKRFRSMSLRSSSSKKLSNIQNNKIFKTRSETISLIRSSDTDHVFTSDSSHSLSTSTTNGGYGSSSASSFSSNSNSVLRRNGSFERNLNKLKQVQQQQHHQKKNVRRSKFLSTNIGLSLIALSLLVLVVWGKICAILCTSTWMLLLSATFKERGVVKNLSKWDDRLREEDVDSGEYKKRVIMEGLLERNRSGDSSSRRL